MAERRQYGFSDADLAAHPTVYAAGSLAGQVSLVSGGGGGIGRATCWLLARLGAHVVATGRAQAKLDSLLAGLHAAGLSASAAVADVRDAEAIGRVLDQIWERHGRLDLLVNSAGGQFPSPALDIPEKGWKAVVDTNLNGSWLLMQAAARRWRQAGRPGAIVNIVVVTQQGLYGLAHSVAARAGVIGLSRNLAVEWAPYDIRINCVAPGAIETDGWNVYPPSVIAQIPQSNPMKRAGTAWDVAESVVYLGGPAGRYVTGEVLHVAGGSQLWGEAWTIPRPEHFAG